MKRIAWILLAAYIALACALFLPQLWWPDAALYTRVTFSACNPLGPCLTSNSTAAPSSRLR